MECFSRSVARLVVLLMVFLAGAAEGDEAPKPAAVPRAKEGKGGNWLEAHQKLVERVRSGPCDLLFVGDSITQHWLTADRGKPIWEAEYAPLRAVNIGKAGDTTGNILWRLQNGGLGTVRPKVIVLLAGVNNLKQHSAEETAGGVEAIVRELRARIPEAKILLLGIFPKGGKNDPARTKIADVNAALSRFADGKQVFFLDIGGSFLTPGGALIDGCMVDGLHPSAEGYRIWADSMRSTLNTLRESSAHPL